MPKYESKTYATGFTLSVDPADRSMDVMHYLMTGGLLGGRSLDGVTWEKIEKNNASKALSASMRIKK